MKVCGIGGGGDDDVVVGCWRRAESERTGRVQVCLERLSLLSAH